MPAQADPSESLSFECDFDEPPEKVWRALTEPRLLETWLTDEPPRAAPREEEAAPSQAKSMPEGRVGSSRYEIITAEPHRLLRYGWRDRESGVGEAAGREVDSVVTVELVPGAMGGTHLRLTHGEFRIVSPAPTLVAARVTSIASARRRRSPTVSCASQCSLRRAA